MEGSGESQAVQKNGAVGIPLVNCRLSKNSIFWILRLPFLIAVAICFQNLRMASLFSTTLSCRYFILVMSVLFAVAVSAQEAEPNSPLVRRELERREASVQEGQMLLLKGDEAYKTGKYEEAATAYAGARDAFPDAPATAELRATATERHAQAAVGHGRMLSRKGDLAGAKQAVEKVLDEAVSPNDSGANAFRAELDDPIRNNPSLTKEHAADVEEVRRKLYTAQGAFDLGKFDEAKRHYEDVIRIDPYNAAARRGMEKVSSQKSGYYEAAEDETRSEMLSMVDGAWELPLSPNLVIPELPDVGDEGSETTFLPVSNKISRIIIPEYRLEQGNLMEAIELLRLRAAENDPFETDPAKKGVNITVNLGDPSVAPAKDILSRTFDLQVSNVPMDQIVKYISDTTGTTVKTDDFAVTIVPAGGGSAALITRTYRTPPDFLSNLSAGGSAEEKADDDIFNTESGNSGLLVERMGAQQALAQQGVGFPDGASASLNAATNTLLVINTEGNLDIIEQIIDSISLVEPVSVAVRITMIRVEQNRLEELGFDWMLNTFSFGGDSWIPGASELNLSGGTTGNGSPITDIVGVPGTIFPTNPITAGNRSGDGAIKSNSIDSLIAAGSSGGSQSNSRAPGIFGVNGIIGSATVQSLMRGLDQKKGVDLMAQPSVTTRSGQAASIQIIREFIYPTEYEPPELPNTVSSVDTGGGGGTFPVTPATPTAFEKKDTGITLEVLPVADANKRYVDVTLNPVITDFDGFVNYGSPINSTSSGIFGSVTRTLTENAILMPVFSVNKVNSNLVVADGATIVIGGLMKDEVTNVNDKTPILSDIPFVGRLFQTDAQQHTSTVVLFLVNVELLDPTGRPYSDR